MKERKLSAAQLSMLKSIRDSGNPWAKIRGRSAHGGADGTIRSLVRRELVAYRATGTDGWFLTPAGISALETA